MTDHAELREALERIAHGNIVPDEGGSVADEMRAIARATLTPDPQAERCGICGSDDPEVRGVVNVDPDPDAEWMEPCPDDFHTPTPPENRGAVTLKRCRDCTTLVEDDGEPCPCGGRRFTEPQTFYPATPPDEGRRRADAVNELVRLRELRGALEELTEQAEQAWPYLRVPKLRGDHRAPQRGTRLRQAAERGRAALASPSEQPRSDMPYMKSAAGESQTRHNAQPRSEEGEDE